MRWTCASCGALKDVPLDDMKKIRSGMHERSPNLQPQRSEDEAKAKQDARAKDGRPAVTLLEWNQLVAKCVVVW